MANTLALPHLLSIFIYLFFNASGQELVVTHAPSYVTFQEQKQTLQTSDVPHVITHTLGIPSNKEFDWSGLIQGSLFKRPKANVMISVVGYEGMAENPLKLQNVAKYPVKNDIPVFDVGSIMNTIQNVFFDKNPLMLDAGIDNNLFDVHTEFDVFRKLPDTIKKMADRLLDSDSVLHTHTVGTLNTSSHSDLKLMGELQLIQDVLNTLTDKPELLKSKTPDLFSFTISGLHDIIKKHGHQSTQATDAKQLVTDFINKATENFRKLYKDNVVVEVLTITPEAGGYVRKVRSLMEEDYSEDYPAIFNIILWLMIIMFLSFFAVSYGIWNMDPGRDSIIYRMTSTRLKKD
ncbi:hypothetical protein KUTeg_012099 [Tegillarca granosa]|uniref:Renin receptor n=1 Tax=Tegillarca granosa TaxID=220873 RepID=A0ABQ9EYK2_TEGGR|nr:hypothetical protein KUTeg_012099 [Tegillarca granosa]